MADGIVVVKELETVITLETVLVVVLVTDGVTVWLKMTVAVAYRTYQHLSE